MLSPREHLRQVATPYQVDQKKTIKVDQNNITLLHKQFSETLIAASDEYSDILKEYEEELLGRFVNTFTYKHNPSRDFGSNREGFGRPNHMRDECHQRDIPGWNDQCRWVDSKAYKSIDAYNTTVGQGDKHPVLMRALSNTVITSVRPKIKLGAS